MGKLSIVRYDGDQPANGAKGMEGLCTNMRVTLSGGQLMNIPRHNHGMAQSEAPRSRDRADPSAHR